jgi:hypothetical protein
LWQIADERAVRVPDGFRKANVADVDNGKGAATII